MLFRGSSYKQSIIAQTHKKQDTIRANLLLYITEKLNIYTRLKKCCLIKEFILSCSTNRNCAYTSHIYPYTKYTITSLFIIKRN